MAMSDIDEEILELRRRLDSLDASRTQGIDHWPGPAALAGLPLDHPVPAPGTWAGDLMLAHEQRRQERVEAAKLRAAAYDAEVKRREERSDALRAEIKTLLEHRERAGDEYAAASRSAREEFDRKTRPYRAQLEASREAIDNQVGALRRQLAELERAPITVELPTAGAADEETPTTDHTGIAARLLGKARRKAQQP